MQIFYKPVPGVVGDCIPFYANGRYHVFYLRDYRDKDSYGIGSPWHHVSTDDFVTFVDHGEALSKGSIDDQDLTVATGSVITDDKGLHHIFYTGINPYFRDEAHHEQAVLHATSKDLISWEKVAGEVSYADESLYERHDWRDPFVYKDPDSGRYHMLLAARTADGPVSRSGCTALLTSEDLSTWTVEKPFYAPGRYHGHECPDLFRMGEWYYLVFSEYTTRTATRYVMSRSLQGPWETPADNMFDNRAFYAAKTAGDEDGRRFLFGWNPSKVGDADGGDWVWGGALTVHEVIQNHDGTLGVRMPQTLVQAFGEPTRQHLELDGTDWTTTADGYRADSRYAYSAVRGDCMGSSCLLEGQLTFADAGEAGVLLHVDAAGDTGYFLRFNPARQALQFGKIGGYRNWYVDHMPELDRPLEIQAGVPLDYRIVVDGSAMVAYVNDQVALSARLYADRPARCGLYADGATVIATAPTIRRGNR
ncbi:glycoside hydrolase family 32 protein [Kribbella sp. NPDC026611]|uniref:glycoside hydrolase family 32 protein n=1 Tax=Kribbella sp. NPDC026611 TaxID=3154911 RepID=UPI0033D6FC0E